jgi:hypothetical protein
MMMEGRGPHRMTSVFIGVPSRWRLSHSTLIQSPTLIEGRQWLINAPTVITWKATTKKINIMSISMEASVLIAITSVEFMRRWSIVSLIRPPEIRIAIQPSFLTKNALSMVFFGRDTAMPPYHTLTWRWIVVKWWHLSSVPAAILIIVR